MDACELPVNIQFHLTLRNNGNLTYGIGDTVRAGLILPGEPPLGIIEILEAELPPAGTVDLDHLEPADQSFTGSFAYILYTDMDEDINRNNDTIKESFTIYGNPEVDLGESNLEVSSFPFLLDAGVGYDSYNWQDGSTAQTFSAPEFGQYWMKVILNGCPGTDTINLVGVNVEALSADGFLQVFPNPNSGDFQITGKSYHGWIEIGIYNVLGECIHYEKIYVANRLSHRIQLEHPVQGPHLLKIGNRIKKVIINLP